MEDNIMYRGAVWKERNNRCHEDITIPFQASKKNCINTSYFWCKETGVVVADQLVYLIGAL